MPQHFDMLLEYIFEIYVKVDMVISKAYKNKDKYIKIYKYDVIQTIMIHIVHNGRQENWLK